MKRLELYKIGDNCPIGQINVMTDSYRIKGVSYIPNSWNGETGEVGDKDFFASYTVKWDGCSHFMFYGEGYPNFKDSYYHICGVYSYVTHIRMMQFILEVAYSQMKDVFFNLEVEDLMELRKFNLLDGYEIKEVNIPEWEIEDLEKIINE